MAEGGRERRLSTNDARTQSDRRVVVVDVDVPVALAVADEDHSGHGHDHGHDDGRDHDLPRLSRDYGGQIEAGPVSYGDKRAFFGRVISGGRP